MGNNSPGNISSNSLVLYGHPGSRSPLVNWAANELGISLKMGDLAENPHPFGKLPCLTDKNGEVGIFESGAILQYLQDKYGDNQKLSAGQSAALMSWIVWANASLEPICFLSSDDGKIRDTGLRGGRNPNALKDIDRLDEILANVSRQQQRRPPGQDKARLSSPGPPGSYPPSLSSSSRSSSNPSAFLLGSDFTLADVAVASYLLFALRFYPETDLSRWPNIVKYLYACASRKSYARAYGKDIQQSLLELLREMNGGQELASDSFVLYGHPSSMSPIINWADNEFGFDLIMGNLAENPHPYGKVPCLTDQKGKVMVFENSAILQYLQDHFEKSDMKAEIRGGRNMPGNIGGDESEKIKRWIEWAGNTLEPICLVDARVRDQRNRPGSPPPRQLQSQQPTPLHPRQRNSQPPLEPRREADFYARQGIDFEALEELNRILGQNQRQLEQRLQEPSLASGGRVIRDVPPSSCFLVGDKFSLADVAVASLLLYIPQNFPGTDLNQWPFLVRYMKAAAQRQAYAQAFGPDVQDFVLNELDIRPRGAGPGPGPPPPPPPPPRGPSRMGRGPGDRGGLRRDDGRGLFTPSYRT
jgi:glutathione S-transferase/alpha,alpha-trehalase